MYGLINNSLKSMIVEKFGEEQWQGVLKASGVPEDSFLKPPYSRYSRIYTYHIDGMGIPAFDDPESGSILNGNSGENSGRSDH